ncbi:hypothetical protein GJ496_005914 [Pomphorhynchus laevis]|nr:hypothetical protein GJ496_005914 [Pomphorhynchus laevis]
MSDSSDNSYSSLNSGGDRQQIMSSVQQQIAVQNFQELLQKISEKCFKMCVTKPGSLLSNSEQKCLNNCTDRYIDSFNTVSRTYLNRTIQVIIQSRSGCPNFSHCYAYASADDWFNLSLQYDNDIDSILENLRVDLFGDPLSHCIFHLNIYLDSKILLEQWAICWNGPRPPKSKYKQGFELYQSLSQLLRSIITASRTLPAYQHCMSFEYQNRLQYQVINKQITQDSVVENTPYRKQITIGQCITSMGSIYLSVSYLQSLEIQHDELANKVNQLESKMQDLDIDNKPLNNMLDQNKERSKYRNRKCIPAFINNSDSSDEINNFPFVNTIKAKSTTIPNVKLQRFNPKTILSTNENSVHSRSTSFSYIDKLPSEDDVVYPLVSNSSMSSDKSGHLFELYKHCESLLTVNISDSAMPRKVFDKSLMEQLQSNNSVISELISTLTGHLNEQDNEIC